MEIYNLPNDIKVFGFQVTSFPQGIGEAFETLIKAIPGGFDRPYYGVSFMDQNGKMIYNVAAQEKYEGEADKYNYKKFVVEKGEYLTITLRDWRKKTDCIKDLFNEIIGDSRADKTKPAVEWYKNDDEMMCLVKTLSLKK